MSDYLTHVKSTIDKIMYDLVDSLQGQFPGLEGADTDNIVDTDEFFKSTEPVLLWQFLTMSPVPRDPLYSVTFLVGAKTVNDSSNYQLTYLSDALNDTFAVNNRIEVGNYSGATAVPNTGYFLITDITFAPHQFDNMSGIRFFSVTAMGARNL